MICHTHWDREWYLTREVFRTKLVRLIDRILDIVDASPGYVSFMLDGQTIVLEDYLQIRPENTERLKSALNSGKVLCGPWYILPDELLVSGEALIRNYRMGARVSARYGGYMNVAYLPDSFGHPEQMPQIAQGLGMDTMVFWRGTSNAVRHSEFYWQSPYSGSKVLCIHMPAGYGNSARLKKDDKTIGRLENMIRSLRERSLTDVVLLMNGSDHIIAQDDIVEIVNRFNRETRKNYHIRLSTMPDYIRDVRSRLPEAETFSGEFRYGDRSLLLGGTLSTRMEIKQRNHIVQKKMERYLEPIKALEQMLGIGTQFGGYSNYIWKRILENHPHDSICGCSVDEVHREMFTRFDCVGQLEEELLDYGVKELEQKLVTSERAAADAQLLVFEPTQDRLQDYVEIEVDIDPALVQEVDYNKSAIVDYEDRIRHPDPPSGLLFRDEYGREIPHIVLSAGKAYYRHLQDETLPEIYKVNRIKAGLLLPPFDYGMHLIRVYKAGSGENQSGTGCVDYQTADPDHEALDIRENCTCDAKRNRIENEFYRITFNKKTAALDVLDKKTGRLHTGVHKIIDKGDAGDEYTYSWPLHDRVYTLKADHISITAEKKGNLSSILRIQGVLELPQQLTEDRRNRSEVMAPSDIEIDVTLHQGTNRIDFHTMMNNRAKDHRLQVEFPAGVLARKSSASGAFAVTERDIGLVVPENWVEYPQSTHPTHGFADVGSKDYGLSLASLGLTEFEAENVDGQSFVRLTLLRCVGWLSRTDLLTRVGNGGWTIETPDAQCPGRHEFDYSILYHEGDWRQSNAYPLCDRRIHNMMVQQLRDSRGGAVCAQNPLAFLSQLPSGLRISAVKPSDQGKGILLRIFSIADRPVQAVLRLPEQITAVYETNLKEERIRQLGPNSGSLTITMEPSQIETYEFE